MNYRHLLLAGCFSALSLAASAAPRACPDLTAASQVNACPTEEELKYTYSGFCSDAGKAYANQTDSCIRYEDYRAMKNVALWESADGAFDGYVSCDLPVAEIKTLKATGMKVETKGKLKKLVCSYPGGVNFTYRTKGSCAVDNAKACASDPASCQASCN
ncbi:MAG: hypothetical protein CVU16_12450 [Betaproteobacteria bacterium HGW-Betaproteobacteria-10]|nr:MAG: hypothetical protein CVU16_12450 [Betaproteobacteria bacterium HGW-Betaproteobacteria-10]